eukprot:366520-Chlamydomonas_euryale.AAC.22
MSVGPCRATEHRPPHSRLPSLIHTCSVEVGSTQTGAPLPHAHAPDRTCSAKSSTTASAAVSEKLRTAGIGASA